MRKLIGSVVIISWMTAYIAIAAIIGDRVALEHWAVQAVFFPIAGLAWIIPLRPLVRWMVKNDTPPETPDI
ncbi:DUF2842 domain-containing protein [bacterium]|nr:DUF2842 domain-containing protein [bacterium]